MSARDVPRESIQLELERILGSQTFAHADRASRFLRFVVEQYLQDPGTCLKEYSIGTAVLGRDDSFDSRTDSIVRVEAGRLRCRLKDYYEAEGREDPTLIDLPKGGYVPVFEERLSPFSEPRSEEAATQTPIGSRRGVLIIVTVGLVVLVGLVAALWYATRNASERVQSLAVLPLTNLSGDPGQEYLMDGLTDLLIAEVSKIPGLRVISRSSVMRYKGSTKSATEIARELKVDALLEGSVMRSGNQVRVTAQLIHAATERHLWAEIYEKDLRDILALQGEVARAVANGIRIKLTRQDYSRLAGARQIHPDALDAYLKGRYFASKRTEDSLRKSVEHFQLAIEKDPAYAPAHSGLGDAYILLTTYQGVSAREYQPKIKAAALRALQLDESLAEAHVLLGQTRLFHDADWPGSEKEYRRAIELDPQFATAHQRYALNLMWMGRFDEALQENKRAQELDPLSPILSANEGEIYYNSRQYDRAIEHCRKVIEREPNFFGAHRILGEAYVAKGMYGQAISELQTAISAGGGALAKGKLGYAYAVSGNKGAAMEIIDELAKARHSDAFAFDIAVIYQGLGDKNRAFQWLQRTCEQRTRARIFLKIAPVLDPLRTDPRFEDLVRCAGMAE